MTKIKEQAVHKIMLLTNWWYFPLQGPIQIPYPHPMSHMIHLTPQVWYPQRFVIKDISPVSRWVPMEDIHHHQVLFLILILEWINLLFILRFVSYGIHDYIVKCCVLLFGSVIIVVGEILLIFLEWRRICARKGWCWCACNLISLFLNRIYCTLIAYCITEKHC